METIILGLSWYLIFVFSTTCHEAAHAYAAYKLGDPTAFLGGQMSLNPTPHINREPIGMVLVPLLSYLTSGWVMGWASVPYNRSWAEKYPGKALSMALAGPLANLVLVLTATMVIRIGLASKLFFSPDHINYAHLIGATAGQGIFETLSMLLSITFTLNLLLFVFNLLPFPPLDGSAIFPFILSKENYRKYMALLENPGASFVGLLIAWRLIDYVFFPVYSTAINLLNPYVVYVHG